MKKIFKYFLLVLFGVNCIASVILENYDAACGWACAFMCELEVKHLRAKVDKQNNG